jgi:hypothetical protein
MGLCALTALAQSVAPSTNEEQDLGNAAQLPLVVYSRHYNTPCYGDYVPTPTEADGKFSVSLAANEFEPIQIGLYVPASSDLLKKITLDVDVDVPHKVGHIHYESYREHWRPIDKGRWYTDYPGGRRALPLYMIPVSTIEEIQPGHSAAFWITFKPDEDCQAGIHRGHFTVTIRGQEPQRYELQVQIHPFSLPRPDVAFSLYARPDRIPRYWTRKYQEMYAQDMAEHGFNSGQICAFYPSFASDAYQKTGRVPPPPTAGQWIEPWTTLLEPKNLTDGKVDPGQLVAAQIEILKQAGLAQLDVPIFTVQDSWTCAGKSIIAETFRQFAVEKGWPEILFSTRDEPPPWRTGPHSITAESIQGMLDFKRLKNCRTFTALSGPSALSWGHLHDVWIVLAGQISPELVREAKRQGAKLWTYSERLRITNLRANRYYAGLYTWGLGLDGNTAYCYGQYVFPPKAGEGAQDPVWLPDHGRTSMHVINGYIIPGPNGPISSMGFEGRREGIDDFRYLQLLEARLKATDVNSVTAREARNWLDGLKKIIHDEAIQGVFSSGHQYLWELDWVEPSPNFKPVEYAALRDKAASFIVQLAAAPNEINLPPTIREFPPSGWEGETFEKESIDAIVLAMQQGSESEQRAAATALFFKKPSEKEIPRIVQVLPALLEQPEVRMPVLQAIRTLGPNAGATVPIIKKLLKDEEDPLVRCNALLALGSIGPDAVDALIIGLEDPFHMNKSLAAECLARLGTAAAKALPALEAAADSPNESISARMRSSMNLIREGSK